MGTRHELKVPKTCATWPDAPLTAGCSSPRRLAARAWDDLRLVGWKHPPDPGLGREYEDFYNTHRRHRTLNQAAPLRPLPFRRLAAAHPQTVNAVFRKVLRQPNFTWAEHGEALLRRRKPWYYEHEPRPDISVLGARLSELLRQ